MTNVIGRLLYIILQNVYVVAVYTYCEGRKWNKLIIELYKVINFWSFDIYDGIIVLMLCLCMSGVYWVIVEPCGVEWRVSRIVQGVWVIGSLFVDQ